MSTEISLSPRGPRANARFGQRISKGSENEINACFKCNLKPLWSNTNLFSEKIKTSPSSKSTRPFPQ